MRASGPLNPFLHRRVAKLASRSSRFGTRRARRDFSASVTVRGVRRVLLSLGWYDYRLHRGIEKYAHAHDWNLSQDLAREKVIPWGWDGNGILAWLGAGDDLAEFVLHAGKPTVDFSFRRPHLPFAHVLEDHPAAGRLVAEHFLARGLRNFIYYSDAPNWVYQERGQGFIEAITRAGRKCNWLRWHESPSRGQDGTSGDASGIGSLPKCDVR